MATLAALGVAAAARRLGAVAVGARETTAARLPNSQWGGARDGLDGVVSGVALAVDEHRAARTEYFHFVAVGCAWGQRVAGVEPECHFCVGEDLVRHHQRHLPLVDAAAAVSEVADRALVAVEVVPEGAEHSRQAGLDAATTRAVVHVSGGDGQAHLDVAQVGSRCNQDPVQCCRHADGWARAGRGGLNHRSQWQEGVGANVLWAAAVVVQLEVVQTRVALSQCGESA